MAKRISDTQRIINFAMAADEPTLNAAVETLTAIRANRFPKGTPKPRKPRSDKGSKKQDALPGTEGLV